MSFFSQMSTPTSKRPASAVNRGDRLGLIQSLFETAAKFDKHRDGLQRGGYNFTAKCVEKLECTDVSPETVMVTAVTDEIPRSTRLDGDYFASQPALAYWRLAEGQAGYQTARTSINLQLIGVGSSDEETYQQMSAREQTLVSILEESPGVARIRCPEHFMAVRVEAPEAYQTIVDDLLSASGAQQGSRSGKNGTLPGDHELDYDVGDSDLDGSIRHPVVGRVGSRRHQKVATKRQRSGPSDSAGWAHDR